MWPIGTVIFHTVCVNYGKTTERISMLLGLVGPRMYYMDGGVDCCTGMDNFLGECGVARCNQ